VSQKSFDYRRLLYVLIGLGALAVLIASQRAQSVEPVLHIGLSSPQSGSLQVFFDTGSGFSESGSTQVAFNAGDSDIEVPVPGGLKTLRLDPGPELQSIVFKTLSVSTRPHSQQFEIPLAGLRPANEVASMTGVAGGMRVQMLPGSKDAQLLMAAGAMPTLEEGPARLALWAKAFLGLLVLGFAVFGIVRSPQGIPVPALLLAASVLVAALALTSTTTHSIHPDEHNHVAAARYYFDHWKPPAVDDPAIVDTYTIYGTSYLNELDVGYLVAAKVSNLWSGFGLDDTLSLRLFNVLLLAVLLAIAWMGRGSWVGAAALLVTPQLWYMFSYFNADAFPLFLSVVLTFLFAAPTSAVSDYVEGRSTRIWSLLMFALALGLLLVSKRNYLLVVLFISLFLSVRHLRLPLWCVAAVTAGGVLLGFSVIGGQNMYSMFPSTGRAFMPVGGALLLAAVVGGAWQVLRNAELRPRFYRMGALFFVAAAIALPRIVLDRDVNGSSEQKAQKTLAAAEKYGELRFKPSTLANDPASSYPGRNLAAKGVGLSQIMAQPYGWPYHSWRSSLGVYGYMNVFAPDWLYRLLSVGLVLCLTGMLRHAARDASFRPDLFVATCVSVLVALSSIVHSWAYDFQPQGRYLMPIVALGSALMLAHPILMKSRLVRAGLAMSWLAATFSFLFFAIPVLADR
jgi:hypothetical protein